MDEQNKPMESANESRPSGVAPRGRAFQAAALGVTLMSLLTCGFFMLHWFRPPDLGGSAQSEPPVNKGELFKQWPHDRQPDLVLVLSSQQHGYMKPCGCSRPQLGGLPRRYNFFAMLKARGWTIVPLDAGDIAQKSGPQAKLKYEYSMKALKQLGYAAVGIGLNEINTPLIEALAQYSLDHHEPRVLAANLKNQENFVNMLESVKVVAGKHPKVGVIGAVGASVKDKAQNNGAEFDQLANVLPGAIKQLQGASTEINVLLYQGDLTEAKACAEFCKKKSLPLNVIVCSSAESEPPQKPTIADGVLIVNVGHKGRYLGVVGVYRTGKPDQPFEYHYELAPIGEDFESKPENMAQNPIMQLVEEYARQVKSENFLSRYHRTSHPIQLNPKYAGAKYVGSHRCKNCHKEAFKVWENTPHAHAYETLEKAKHPSLAQFDGECVKCHVVGFNYKTGFENKEDTPKLLDVGCENCHGPGSEHVKLANRQINDPVLNDLMNPWRYNPTETPAERSKRELKIDLFCQQCHDIDNDVHWTFDKWKKIVHHEPALFGRNEPAKKE